MTILNFELFKNQKELDNEYTKFLNHCNKYFGTDVSPEGIFKRLYFVTRCLVGTVNGYKIFSLCGLSDKEYKKGTLLFYDWLEAIVKDLRDEK